MINTTEQFYKDTRLKYIIALALIALVIAQVFGLTQLALGILAGFPIGIFNYWLMWDAIKKGETLANKDANKIFLGRSFLRMIVALAALILAMKIGPLFVLGVMVGLFLHLITYLSDIYNILLGNKFS